MKVFECSNTAVLLVRHKEKVDGIHFIAIVAGVRVGQLHPVGIRLWSSSLVERRSRASRASSSVYTAVLQQ